jgi:hypothetical protein
MIRPAPVVGSTADTDVTPPDPSATDSALGTVSVVPTTGFVGESNVAVDRS